MGCAADAATGCGPGAAIGAVVGGIIDIGGAVVTAHEAHKLLNQLHNKPAPQSNPFKVKPGGVSETKTRDGKPKQTRHYCEDGYPSKDVDHDHDHGQGQGQPHVHDWTRPSGGGPPTHEDRQPGRVRQPGEIPKQPPVQQLPQGDGPCSKANGCN